MTDISEKTTANERCFAKRFKGTVGDFEVTMKSRFKGKVATRSAARSLRQRR